MILARLQMAINYGMRRDAVEDGKEGWRWTSGAIVLS